MLATRYKLFDKPNPRSSHSEPTPRGGGLAIVMSVLISCLVFHSFNPIFGVDFEWQSGFILVVTFLLAVASFFDDLLSLSVSVRLSLQGFLSLIVVFLVGPIPMGDVVPISVSIVLTAIVLMWLLNLYNFMDGIDGLAASETSVVCIVAAAILMGNNTQDSIVVMAIALGGSALGFLVWNWSPAKLFMGDSGSVFLGFTIGSLALFSVQETALSMSVWLILLATFTTDASYTLIRRLLAGQNIFYAHRSHGYQVLADRWGSHKKVTSLYMVINLFWLVPIAVIADNYPELAINAVAIAYIPLLAMMAKLDNLA